MPFGISDDYRNTDEYHEDYVLIYKQMEESLSKQIYQLLGISIESIAASIHQYIDIDHDDEMIEMIQKSQEIMKTVINLSQVVDLTPIFHIDSSINNSYDISLDSPSIIAEVLDNVLKVINIILSKESSNEKFDYTDEYYKDIFNIDIARRVVSPSQRSGDLLSLEIYKMLLNSLTVKINDNIVVLSTIQYYTLLELYQNSNEVQQVLLRHIPSKDKIVLNDIRYGNWNMIYTIQPTIACCIQLNKIIDQEIERSPLAEVALKRITSMQESKFEVKRALSMDDKEEALTILDKALSTDMEEEEECDNNHYIMLPIHMRVEILTCRADIHSKMGNFEEGLADCDEAIALDKYNCSAYAIRAEIYGQLGDLQSAAQDALAAFLFGGSTDLSLAASAEDAARACCRLEAKDIYNQRREKDESSCPKDWMVCSYLTGYEPLSSSLAVDPEAVDNYDKNFYEHRGIDQTHDNDEVYDIDLDVDRLDLGNLIQPPTYMIDTDDNGSIIEKPKDNEAFWLLRRLVALLDTAQFKENVLNNDFIESNGHNDNNNNNNIEDNSIDDGIKTFSSDDEFLDLINHLLSEDLIDFGICESNEDIDNNNNSNSNKEMEIDFSKVVVRPNSEYIQALQLLKSTRASMLTGVLFSSGGGGIVSVKPSSRVVDDDDDDDNWEDCDDEEEEEEEEEGREGDEKDETWNSPISCKIRARLLNICGVIAYLSGDAKGSVQCLRVSMKDDPTLLDSQLKLGSILVDMDERDEATKLLSKSREKDPFNPIVYLHLAELEIHNNDFQSAVSYLWKAQNYCESFQLTSPLNVSWYIDNSSQLISDIALNKLRANITALLGVALFRNNPNSPENAVMELRRGIEKYPNAIYLQLCLGEVLSQLGDAVGALELFKKAAKHEPSNPVPFINAARTYQQMNQRSNAARHLNHALHTDPSLAMTKVDFAQNLMHSGKTEEALAMLDEALQLAKHVSEICDVLTARKIATIQLQLQEESKQVKLFQYMDMTDENI